MSDSATPPGPAPEITTDIPGLILRELTIADAGAYFELLDVNREHLSRLGDYQEEGRATPAWARAHLSEATGQNLRYGIRLNGALIGRLDLLAIDPPRYGTGYWLDEHHTGSGYAAAACRALCDHAARQLGATDIFAGVTHGNTRSVSLLERLGFENVAEFEHYDRFQLRLVR